MKINFIISRPYCNLFCEVDNYSILREEKRKLEEITNSKLPSIVKDMSQYTKCDFKKEEYDCYLVPNFPKGGISCPLTIKIQNKPLGEFLTLIHESIHILMVENKTKFRHIINNLKENYPKEKHIIIVHVVLFDILREVIKNNFEKDYFKEIKEKTIFYKRSFEIVEEMKNKEENFFTY